MSKSNEKRTRPACFQITEFDCWEPGRSVVLRVPRGGPLVYVLNMAVFAVVFGIPSGFLTYYVFNEFVTEISYLEAMLIGMIPFATLGSIQIAAVDSASTVEIDWSQGELRTSSSEGSQTYPLGKLESLVVCGLYHTRLSRASGSSRTTKSEKVYRGRLEARIDGKTVALLQTDTNRDSDEHAVSDLSALAQELADALGVELHNEEPVREKHARLLSSFAKAPLWLTLCFALQIVLVGGYLVRRAQPAFAMYRLQGEVEQLGGSVSELNLTVANHSFGTVSGIYFPGKPIEDEELVALREGLLNWKPFMLDLSETGITDRGLQSIAGNNNLLSIDLRETAVTDEGVKSLSQCESLVQVNLNRTRVSDESISHLSRLPKLESLQLWGTRITDKSIPDLARMTNLRELILNETRVTPAGLKQLRELLPHTEISP